MRSAYTVGSRIAMLYQGRVQQVGTVDEIRNTTDPIVRQFIEGRPTLEEEPFSSIAGASIQGPAGGGGGGGGGAPGRGNAEHR
jgi:phospholipid/cholesterol/gamma-HCH transport system ATP-binding protein